MFGSKYKLHISIKRKTEVIDSRKMTAYNVKPNFLRKDMLFTHRFLFIYNLEYLFIKNISSLLTTNNAKTVFNEIVHFLIDSYKIRALFEWKIQSLDH